MKGGNTSGAILLILLAAFLIAMGVSPKGLFIWQVLTQKGVHTIENK